MNLLKTSFLNGIAVLIKTVVMLVLNKVLAIYVGPAGYAAIGQFQNAIQLFVTFASGAINTGVTKYTAEYYDKESEQIKLWRTAGVIAIAGSLITSLFVFIFNKELSLLFLGDIKYKEVFLILSISLPFYIFNFLLLAILNGKKQVKKYVLSNILGSLIGLFVTLFLVIKLNLLGALIALAIHQSLTFFATFILCHRADWFQIKYFVGSIDKKILRNLFGFTAMALVSAICVPLSHVLIRSHLNSEFGLESTGYWEATWRLSSSYLLLVTTTLSLYLLPRLSEIKVGSELKKELISAYKLVLPLLLVLILSIYFFRDLLVELLFSNDFRAMEKLFFWQLIGDFLKVGSWILAYVLLARAYFKVYIVIEILFTVSLVSGTVIFTKLMGFEGVSFAHAVNYFFYWLCVAFLVYKRQVGSKEIS